VKITKTSSTSAGLGVIVGTPPGQMGGFGEFDLVFLNQFTLSSEEKSGSRCDLTAKGAALRFGGGGVFPLASWFQLAPFAAATIGRFTTINGSAACPPALNVGEVPSGDVRTHTMIVLGVGGDIVLGKNR
jgi:hypothetical protein